MTVNAVLSRTKYNQDLKDCLTELENLTVTQNIKSDTYNYYRCEYITAQLRLVQVVVAVYED
jgi:hypothetical protein